MLLKLLRWVSAAIITVIILCWLFIWLVASGIDETTTYTENDFFNYHMLTDQEIKKAPRISGDYYFKSYPGDGYAPANTIIFKGASNVEPLRVYLKKLGYTRQRTDSEAAETWIKPEEVNSDLFYLYSNAATGEVELSKEMNN
ncbi:hypothetical protein [Pseudescherichia vulneris]|uniref:hypothetical protein n=1 Tax=Pseudescherichia vulneris TaxID=566 RepID=UPI001EE09DBF|nr:hypothetical protein [Pseudescherichia vulneris]